MTLQGKGKIEKYTGTIFCKGDKRRSALVRFLKVIPLSKEQTIETVLWNYLDGRMSGEEKIQVEDMLQNNVTWQACYKELVKLNQVINAGLEPDEPPMYLTKNVMEKISALKIAPAAKNYIDKKIINGIATFFITVIAGFLIYSFLQINWPGTGSTWFQFDLGKLNLAMYLSRQVLNVLLMLNVMIGLILLDKYFTITMSKVKRKS